MAARNPSDGSEKPRIDVKTLPESVAELWETMLRMDPTWSLSDWLDGRARDELALIEKHLGNEKMRLEQRMHRVEALAKSLKRKREAARGTSRADPHQRNLFDIYGSSREEERNVEVVDEQPLVDLGALGTEDDPLLTIVAEHIMNAIEEGDENGRGDRFEDILLSLGDLGIRSDEVDEGISWLLQRSMIIEIDQDVFRVDG